MVFVFNFHTTLSTATQLLHLLPFSATFSFSFFLFFFFLPSEQISPLSTTSSHHLPPPTTIVGCHSHIYPKDSSSTPPKHLHLFLRNLRRRHLHQPPPPLRSSSPPTSVVPGSHARFYRVGTQCLISGVLLDLTGGRLLCGGGGRCRDAAESDRRSIVVVMCRDVAGYDRRLIVVVVRYRDAAEGRGR